MVTKIPDRLRATLRARMTLSRNDFGASIPQLAGSSAGALSCPWCGAPAMPSAMPQACARCARRFTLSAGPALDGSVLPPPFHPGAIKISLKWSILVTYRFAVLEPGGVTSGTLDPVVAIAPVEQSGIAYGDVLSVAVWRKIAWMDCVVGALIPLPIALLATYGAILAGMTSGGVTASLGLVALGVGVIAGWLLYRGFVIGRRRARIVGRWHSFTVPFDGSHAFHGELFRRCGIVPPPIP